MRNRVLQLVNTKQVLLIDADFVPSFSLRGIAQNGLVLPSNQALVLPIFNSIGAEENGAQSQVLSTLSCAVLLFILCYLQFICGSVHLDTYRFCLYWCEQSSAGFYRGPSCNWRAAQQARVVAVCATSKLWGCKIRTVFALRGCRFELFALVDSLFRL